MHELVSTIDITRRSLLRSALALAACGAAPTLAWATPRMWVAADASRSLRFHNTHTGENLTTQYWEKGRYIPEALHNISHVLRDHRTNEVKPIDPHLLDVLARLHQRLDSRKPFDVISGYRSARSNELLHAHSSEVACHSMHIYGKAIDIRLTNRSLSSLRNEALAFQAGGVGYYPSSDFVHVDTGRVRRWQGA